MDVPTPKFGLAKILFKLQHGSVITYDFYMDTRIHALDVVFI